MVNEHFNTPQVLEQIKRTLENEGTVQLQDFLAPDLYNQLIQTIKETALAEEQQLLTHTYKKGPVPYMPEVEQFLQFIDLKQESASLKVFTWKDYMLLHDNNQTLPEYEIILDCTDAWDENAGGEITYTDGEGNSGTLPAKANTLTITKTQGLQRFVHYCNHYAKDKQRVLIFISASSN